VATVQEPQRVSAADFIRVFANWRLQSARRPVFVTHHGKDAHVLISFDDYRRMDRDCGPVGTVEESLAAVVESIRDAAILIDRQWRIAALNPVASDMLEQPAAALIGEPIHQALPKLSENMLVGHLGRLLDRRERFSGDITGLVRPKQWLRVDLVPVPIGGALIMRDISETMAEACDDMARRALAAALEAHGAIAHARISVREMIEDANDVLVEMV
jgi:PAS domain-containing protein